MSQQTERRPGDRGGVQVVQAGEATQSVQPDASRRRHRLHYRLVVRRRISRELDELLAEIGDSVPNPEPGIEGDYWHDSHMDLGLPERERVGRQLLAVGWVPR